MPAQVPRMSPLVMARERAYSVMPVKMLVTSSDISNIIIKGRRGVRGWLPLQGIKIIVNNG